MSPGDELAAIAAILPPPVEPFDRPGPASWRAAEEIAGVVIPRDFKDFVERYGSGSVDGLLIAFNPAASRDTVRLGKADQDLLKALREIRGFAPEEVPYPIHPESGGLLVWGTTDNGDICCWLTSDADPDRWAIAIGEARGPRWFSHPGPFTRFLHDVLRRSLQVPFLPAQWPAPRPVHRPLPAE